MVGDGSKRCQGDVFSTSSPPSLSASSPPSLSASSPSPHPLLLRLLSFSASSPSPHPLLLRLLSFSLLERAIEQARQARQRVEVRLAKELYFQQLFRAKVWRAARLPWLGMTWHGLV